MAKFKPLNENQLVMLPISLQDQLVPGTLEHTISEMVDKHLDLSVFDVRYKNDETGATAHTGCVAFGMDRLAVAMFHTHRTDLSAWPAKVREIMGMQPLVTADAHGEGWR